jgi:hypothetical protein
MIGSIFAGFSAATVGRDLKTLRGHGAISKE